MKKMEMTQTPPQPDEEQPETFPLPNMRRGRMKSSGARVWFGPVQPSPTQPAPVYSQPEPNRPVGRPTPPDDMAGETEADGVRAGALRVLKVRRMVEAHVARIRALSEVPKPDKPE
jgi:hypothetical protein